MTTITIKPARSRKFSHKEFLTQVSAHHYIFSHRLGSPVVAGLSGYSGSRPNLHETRTSDMLWIWNTCREDIAGCIADNWLSFDEFTRWQQWYIITLIHKTPGPPQLLNTSKLTCDAAIVDNTASRFRNTIRELVVGNVHSPQLPQSLSQNINSILGSHVPAAQFEPSFLREETFR